MTSPSLRFQASKTTSENQELIKANVTCERTPLSFGFVFSRIFGKVSSCVLYHKASLVLLLFRIGGIFGSFLVSSWDRPYRRKRYRLIALFRRLSYKFLLAVGTT